jgi:hypothetical protein
MKKICICTENILEKAELFPDEGLIKNVCVMRSVSLNGRRYMKKAMESVSEKVGKSFWNHQTAGMGGLFGAGPRDVRDLIGKLSDGRMVGDAVYADLKVRKKWREDVFDIAQNYSDTCGFSIVAKGKFADEKDSEGYDIVEDVEELFSTDLVDDPATTHGLFESVEGEIEGEEEPKKPFVKKQSHQSKQAEGGENVMFEKILEVLEKYLPKKDVKGLSEDGAVAKIDDMLAELKVTVEAAIEDTQRMKDELGVVNAKLVDTEKECDKLRVEIEAYRVKEEKEATLKKKMDFIGQTIEEVGLDDSSVSEDLYNILLKLEEEEVKTMLKKFSEKVSTITDSGKDRDHVKKEDKNEENNTESVSVEDYVKRYMKRAVIVEED